MTGAAQTVSPRRGRRFRRAAAVSAGIAVVAATVVGALGLGADSDDPGTQPAASTVTTTAVERRTLVASSGVDGTVDFGSPAPLLVKATGTITWLPPVGAALNRGDQVLRIDDRPVTLLYGALPQYRELAATPAPEQPADSAAQQQSGATAAAPPAGGRRDGGRPDGGRPDGGPGAGAAARNRAGSKAATPKAPAAPVFTGNDVEQFERNLAALGFRGFTVDAQFTEATTAAVKRWQRSLGRPGTGRVGLGDIVYATGAVRVAKVGARVGAAASEDVVSVSGDTKLVTAKAPADELSWAKKGTAVSVELPGGATAAGTVTSAANPAAAEKEGGDGTVTVTVTVKDQKALGKLQGGEPVTVTYVAEKRQDVLCVPVPALVALVEGGYGLEPAEPGRSGFVAVQTGLFADGMVEVTGPSLTEGLKVRMPQ